MKRIMTNKAIESTKILAKKELMMVEGGSLCQNSETDFKNRNSQNPTPTKVD